MQGLSDNLCVIITSYPYFFPKIQIPTRSVYMNDDFFMLADLTKSDFYTSSIYYSVWLLFHSTYVKKQLQHTGRSFVCKQIFKSVATRIHEYNLEANGVH